MINPPYPTIYVHIWIICNKTCDAIFTTLYYTRGHYIQAQDTHVKIGIRPCGYRSSASAGYALDSVEEEWGSELMVSALLYKLHAITAHRGSTCTAHSA